MVKIPIILLAAGSSSRMGQPKQLLPWKGKTLIGHQIQVLKDTGYPVVVVLGGHSDEIILEVRKTKTHFLINEHWESGMGTSVSAGMDFVKANFPEAQGVLFALVDQPLITTSYLNQLIDSFRVGKQQIVVSSSVNGWLGVPALFDRVYFDELSTLKGKEGAKTLIKKYPKQFIKIDGGLILEDMDTEEKYYQLLQLFNSENH